MLDMSCKAEKAENRLLQSRHIQMYLELKVKGPHS